MQINDIKLNDILVGDVWLCSGQSNMELPVKRVMDMFSNEILNYNNEKIRHILIPQKYNFHAPQEEVEVAAKLQKEGRAFLFAPSHQVKIGTFTTDPKIMQELYDLGISDYKAQKDALRAFLNN